MAAKVLLSSRLLLLYDTPSVPVTLQHAQRLSRLDPRPSKKPSVEAMYILYARRCRLQGCRLDKYIEASIILNCNTCASFRAFDFTCIILASIAVLLNIEQWYAIIKSG